MATKPSCLPSLCDLAGLAGLPLIACIASLGGLAAAAAPARAAAPGGEQLWRFYADFSVTLVEAAPDLSGNGGMDMLVGSADDTLYLVEGRGAGKGAQLWASPFRSTLTAAAVIGDVTGDGKPDVVGGDELGFMQAVNGATGAAVWRWLTFGAVLTAAGVPDVDGDKVPDVVLGSENDTLYCLSGKTTGLLGKVIWQFGAPIKRGRGPGDPPNLPKAAAFAGPEDGVSGVNSVAVLRKGAEAYGVAAGVSNDTVYCFPPSGGAARWKTGLPGDAWAVAAFPDQDGDGIEELLVACGADIGYLLKGGNGAVLWSHALSLGGISTAASADMTGDGKPDALFGDGGGKVHCVPGNASGANAAAAWTYDFGDASTVHSIAALGDVDADGRGDCAVGTSSDQVAVITGKGAKAWSVNLGGTVFSVANLGDLDGNGAADVGAGTEMGFASAFQGHGETATDALTHGGLRPVPAGRDRLRSLRLATGAGFAWGGRDAGGRLRPGKAAR